MKNLDVLMYATNDHKRINSGLECHRSIVICQQLKFEFWVVQSLPKQPRGQLVGLMNNNNTTKWAL